MTELNPAEIFMIVYVFIFPIGGLVLQIKAAVERDFFTEAMVGFCSLVVGWIAAACLIGLPRILNESSSTVIISVYFTMVVCLICDAFVGNIYLYFKRRNSIRK